MIYSGFAEWRCPTHTWVAGFQVWLPGLGRLFAEEIYPPTLRPPDLRASSSLIIPHHPSYASVLKASLLEAGFFEAGLLEAGLLEAGLLEASFLVASPPGVARSVSCHVWGGVAANMMHIRAARV